MKVHWSTSLEEGFAKINNLNAERGRRHLHSQLGRPDDVLRSPWFKGSAASDGPDLVLGQHFQAIFLAQSQRGWERKSQVAAMQIWLSQYVDL